MPCSTGTLRTSRPERTAGCRAYCEAPVNAADLIIIVDIKDSYGVNHRTVSGRERSSTKV